MREWLSNGNDSKEEALICFDDFGQNLAFNLNIKIARPGLDFDTLYYVTLSRSMGKKIILCREK